MISRLGSEHCLVRCDAPEHELAVRAAVDLIVRARSIREADDMLWATGWACVMRTNQHHCPACLPLVRARMHRAEILAELRRYPRRAF
jgi:hypothetical protein